MTQITQSEAASALAEFEITQRQARQLNRYDYSSRWLRLWGSIYVICYGLLAWPIGPIADWVWPVGSLVGIALSFAVLPRAAQPRVRARMLLIPVTLTYDLLCLTVLAPTDPVQISTFFVLTTAMGYVAAGVLFDLPRIVWIGAALAAIVLAGCFALPGHFNAWMAAAGGGALLAGGAWLRRA